MKKYISILLLTSFLVSCWWTEEIVKENKKTDFFVETKLGSEFSGETSFVKTGKVSASQDIILTSNASGRISYIGVKTGDKVSAGQVLASLQDNVWNYGISLQRAEIGIERAQINYDSTKISLDKQVFDAELNLQKLQRNLETLKKDAEQSIIQAKDNVENSQYEWLDSRSALQLQQLDNNIEKAKLDYSIKLAADVEQISSYKSTLKKDFIALQTFLDDIIEFSDKILGITDANRTENDDYEMFLGAEDVNQKRESENLLRAIIKYRDSQEFSNKDALLDSETLSEEETISIIDFIYAWYEQAQDMLSGLEQTLYNTTPSVWEISESQISVYTSTINGYQAQLQSTYGVFISFGSGVKNFLKTYKDNQASILKSIELQEKDREIQFKTLASWELSAETTYEKTIIGIEDNIQNLQDQITIAQNNLQNTLDNRDITLRSLENAIAEAKVSYNSAVKEYSKLTITSPINGTVFEVSWDVWQEVGPGTRLFSIVSDNTPEVEVSFSLKEKEILSLGQKVYVILNNEKIEGNIYSISDIADENLNYKSTITFKSGVNIIGNLVTVEIPISTNKMLIPLNLLSTQGDNIATVNTLSDNTFEAVRVRIWENYGDYVEVVSCAKECSELEIVLNDISNYDENKFVIVEK